ncbi:MAG: DUF4384 domain-containing protein [Desulfobacterium sp.]|nr:DUF4384 domain-containing protein [Desulfobacterium sp.]MBU3949495.1 DUF4384 domain-containing protein [Pseudomonadota bacterium]MBU4037608.1 DUF4384 domain-containing protein [Pseudomonadota bacterium]
MKYLLLIITVLLIPLIIYAEEPAWITAEGTSYQGEMDTLKEVKDRAKQDAQSKAVEMAVGTFIKSHTLVSNSQVAEDLIYAAVRGIISKEEIISSDWDANDRNLYKVNIKALVEPVYPEKGEGLWAKLHLSKTDLKEGDEVQIFYQVSKESYVYIFSIAADGSVTLLFPNSSAPDNFAMARKPYQFPPADSGINLKAMFLPDFKDVLAEEKIKIIATRHKEDLLSLGFREGIFQVYDANSTGMISDLVRRLNRVEPSDWTEATAIYYLRK